MEGILAVRFLGPWKLGEYECSIAWALLEALWALFLFCSPSLDPTPFVSTQCPQPPMKLALCPPCVVSISHVMSCPYSLPLSQLIPQGGDFCFQVVEEEKDLKAQASIWEMLTNCRPQVKKAFGIAIMTAAMQQASGCDVVASYVPEIVEEAGSFHPPIRHIP